MSEVDRNFWREERVLRVASSMRKASFGISFLDDALRGIYPSDLNVIAASTGFGKTELATLIAHENLEKKQVLLIALEASYLELQRRIKYRYIAKHFFENKDRFPSGT